MGDSGEAERPLGEPSPEHVHTLAVRRHDERLRKGERVGVRQRAASGKSFENLTRGCFLPLQTPQKYVMTSEKWLDRLVSASSFCVSGS